VTDCWQQHAPWEASLESISGAPSFLRSAETRENHHAQRLAFLHQAAALESARMLAKGLERGGEGMPGHGGASLT
jgi:hypothetical protein